MKYPGGKNSAGVVQRLINQIPPHRIFVEAFCGSAPIYRAKRPAELTYLIDSDPTAVAALLPLLDVPSSTPPLPDPHGNSTTHAGRLVIANTDAPTWLASRGWTGEEFLYCDPPYLLSTRARQTRRIYHHEISTAVDPRIAITDDEPAHVHLLDVILSLTIPVMISGYTSPLYCDRLHHWRVITYNQRTRGLTTATEYLWMNYPEPAALHDYRYVGKNHRERTDFRRMRERWTSRLAAMPPLKRQALLAAMATSGQNAAAFGPRAAGNGEPTAIDAQMTPTLAL